MESTATRFGNKVSSEISDHVRSLPIYPVRDDLVERINKNQVVVVKGKTGSGKSTQIPQYLASVGYTKNNKAIAVVLPRRAKTKSLAERVATETGTEVGDLVGYAFRHDERTSPNTVIKYVTDGQLNREASEDPKLSQYSVIMLDDTHEKSENTDTFRAKLKQISRERPDLKVVVTSNTMDKDDDDDKESDFDQTSIFMI